MRVLRAACRCRRPRDVDVRRRRWRRLRPERRSTSRTAPRATRADLPRMPTRAALRELTPEHVETALSSFSMRRQGAILSPAERRAVAEFVTGRPGGSYRAPLDVIPRSAYCAAGVSGATAAVDRRELERLGHRRPQHPLSVGGGCGPHRRRRAEAEVEVGVRRAGRLGVGIAGVGGRIARVRRQRATASSTRWTRRRAVSCGRSKPSAAVRSTPLVVDADAPATPSISATLTRRSTPWTRRPAR